MAGVPRLLKRPQPTIFLTLDLSIYIALHSPVFSFSGLYIGKDKYEFDVLSCTGKGFNYKGLASEIIWDGTNLIKSGGNIGVFHNYTLQYFAFVQRLVLRGNVPKFKKKLLLYYNLEIIRKYNAQKNNYNTHT